MFRNLIPSGPKRSRRQGGQSVDVFHCLLKANRTVRSLSDERVKHLILFPKNNIILSFELWSFRKNSPSTRVFKKSRKSFVCARLRPSGWLKINKTQWKGFIVYFMNAF